MKVLERKPLSVWRTLNLDGFMVGVPHYPEHVDESYWDRDAERMAAAGFNTVRMAEFAWHIMEPHEDHFDFSLFDKAIAGLAKHGIKTILCTPTATPPRWLTAKYPEVLRVDANGREASHGSRQHCDTTSPVLRRHSQRITCAMAEHYRDNPHVIGWQTDNELNTTTSESYSPSALIEFQKFCRAKYGTIEAVNFAWGGDFWATAYQTFDQIVFPQPMNPSFSSPGHTQDYHRFLAFATALFQHDQVKILRATNPAWFIFHNLGGLVDIDFRGQFGQDLDFIGFDIYPFLYDEMRRGGGHAITQAFHLDQCRAYSGNFIVPEQASGLGSQPGFSSSVPEPGEMRRMAMTSVSRGADGLMFFRWRPAHFGAEIYWNGIIDHDDVPRRRYEEAKQFASDIRKIEDKLLGTTVRMDIAIAGADFDNQEAYKTYAIGLPSPMQDAAHLHRVCYEAGIACGFIHPEDDLSRIKALYVPHWVMWKEEWSTAVERFVADGGTLILSAMTGTRDDNNHIIRTQAPGTALSRLSGVSVYEFGPVSAPGADGLFSGFREGGIGSHQPSPRPPASSASRKYAYTIGNRQLEAGHLYEKLEATADTEIVGRWSDRFLEGMPMLTRRRHGNGQVYYLGTYLTAPLAEVIGETLVSNGVAAPLVENLPAGVEVSLREGNGRKLLFVLNTKHETKIVDLPAGTDLLTGRTISGRSELQGYGVLVIEQSA
ncbi:MULTISPECIES: beta-galactosidase [Rhizobium]|uniref:Beta-galactosidase n=1 Tax=Rhizobium tropici TaxID=398 RepID=A0A6P1C612_RHITR|nr:MULTISPECIES: beta-galactosidase [Rhizobium]AGB74160.1 beta-D-galactosidase protein [Rhizobium tropici CIAT 899]MBB4240645.1 beta-galactosidase [Rhizobium tropici]MBB5591938.1 beta-galactosidase [Rhizobium tropici]MBB6490992.1 beta-galactosidase [Rhizobium tropici]NEV12649.1 beta-galactosidase [Rhizobium tropici]